MPESGLRSLLKLMSRGTPAPENWVQYCGQSGPGALSTTLVETMDSMPRHQDLGESVSEGVDLYQFLARSHSRTLCAPLPPFLGPAPLKPRAKAMGAAASCAPPRLAASPPEAGPDAPRGAFLPEMLAATSSINRWLSHRARFCSVQHQSYFETIKSPQACDCCSGKKNGRVGRPASLTAPPGVEQRGCGGSARRCVPWGPALASPVQNPPPAEDWRGAGISVGRLACARSEGPRASLTGALLLYPETPSSVMQNIKARPHLGFGIWVTRHFEHLSYV